VLQLKELWGRTVSKKVTAWDGKVLRELEGLPGGRPWEARHGRIVPTIPFSIAHWYSWSRITLSGLDGER
jgi:hypothetical protein